MSIVFIEDTGSVNNDDNNWRIKTEPFLSELWQSEQWKCREDDDARFPILLKVENWAPYCED